MTKLSMSEEEMLKRKYTRPYEKRIAELEATCNKWFEHLKNREEELLNELNNQNAKYNKQIEELEKENAELKEKYAKNITDCDICDTYCNSQLTKAKELLRQFLNAKNGEDTYKAEWEAEQFLNSEVEK